MKNIKTISVEDLKENLSYDENTGLFTRLKVLSNRIKFTKRVGVVKESGYIHISINSTRFAAHRLAWLYMTGEMPKEFIDHINGDRADNRFCNLREVSNTENIQNQTKAHKGSKTGFLGVYAEGKKFFARIKVNGVIHHLGTHDTAEQAHQVYLEAKRRLHKTCTI